ncbi:MAG: NUDIX hydrolase, partial [Lautropia mirabilis]|jgi:hydrolase, NUDIX family|nr:NUDIX hydrolase [Lautropia mirabilis]
VAICVFRHEGKILVARGHDPHRNGAYLRPLGGGIEFGESGAQTLARELKEELGAEIAEVRLIGTLENRFKIGNEPRHEIVLVFDARFEDPSFYTREVIRGKESDGTDFSAIWHRPEETRADCPLYPEGLKELLASIPAPTVTKAPAKPARRKKSLVDLLHAHRADIEQIIVQFEEAMPPAPKRR